MKGNTATVSLDGHIAKITNTDNRMQATTKKNPRVIRELLLTEDMEAVADILLLNGRKVADIHTPKEIPKQRE